jgi:peptidyl-prolyl cis-trans isomerase D
MALMNKMRENTHIILFFLLIMFLLSMTIGGLVGGADILDLLTGRKSDTILTVNGEQVSYEQFSRVYNSQLEQFRQEQKQEPTGYQLQSLENQVWESLVREILQTQELKKKNLSASRDEIKYFLITNPHPIFRMNQTFLNEKNEFDMAKFQSAQSNPENDNIWRYYEEILKMNIPMEKLQDEVLATVRTTDDELKDKYMMKNQTVKVSYVFFDPAKYQIADTEISERDIKNYYNDHEKDKQQQSFYKEEEKRKLRYVLFETKPSANDSAASLSFANSLIDSIKNGSDFAKLAESYSDDPGSAAKGGDLDYFGKGMMTKPFEDAAFAAKIGDIIGPLKTTFGLHIIKVEDRKTENNQEKVRARHILMKYKASRDTQENAKDAADNFIENAKETDFQDAVLKANVRIDTTDFINNSGFISKLGLQRKIVLKAFHMKKEEVSRVQYIEDRGYVIFQVIQINNERIKPLSEIRAPIVDKIRRERQMKKAGAAAMSFREKVKNPEDLERIAGQESLEIKQTQPFKSEDYLPVIGQDAKFNGSAFSLYPQEISKPFEGTRGYYIIRMDEKNDSFNEQQFNAQKEELVRQTIDEKQRSAYNDWLTNLKNNAQIKDYRYILN